LLQALGSYCSICERRMPDECWAWEGVRRALVTGRAAPDTWFDLLLLCHNCQAAAATAPTPSGALALPHRDRTFSLGAASPFTYTLQPVRRVFLKEDGSPEGSAETIERVLVQATTPTAQATIDYFALNTRYFDSVDKILRIPRIDHESLVDRRLDLRTEAWLAAAKHGPTLRRAASSPSRHAFLVVIQEMIATRGFWSTWITVLWRELADRSTVATLALPPRVGGLTAATPALAGAAQDFPGTRGDWLP
jgi:hypothetical protein